MPLSRAPTRGRYSRIVGVTVTQSPKSSYDPLQLALAQKTFLTRLSLDRGKGVPSFDEMVAIVLEEVD